MSQINTQINIPILARVEGEGALDLKIQGDQITQLQLRIYEPPRLFEKFLEGRKPNEVVDAVARICGICPVAYQMSAVQAIEQAFAMNVSPWVREMRRLFYCGEWMESHAIHVHMLAAPDFLGYSSVMEMAQDYPEVVKRGMRLHALGTELMALLGKRSVHPVGACVGGFYYAPTTMAVNALLKRFEDNLSLAEDLVQWTMSLALPVSSQKFISVALCHPDEYPLNEGMITSDHGLSIDKSAFELYFKESQVPYSTALHCLLQGKPYLVGPLARLNLNHHLLPNTIRKLLAVKKMQLPSSNMFHSIIARAIEIYYAMLEAIRIMRAYVYPAHSFEKMHPQVAVGYGCTEAPRGLLWHRYAFNDCGLVESSRIVPPTSQNQARIEEDLRLDLTTFGLERSHEQLRIRSEMVVRNYDPCISCSTHFLKLKVARQ